MKSDFFMESFVKLSQEKRNKILEAAISEFAEYGFDSANINKIAQKAGVSIGSMYSYFGSKENLFLAIIHTGVETLKAVLDDIMSSQEDFLGRIEKIIRAIQANSRTNLYLTKLYNEMTTESHSELVWKIVSDMENVTAGLYASFIREAQEAGIVREDIDPKYFAFFLDNLFVLLQFSYACEYYKERLKIFVGADVFDNDERVVEEMMKFIKGGFLK